MDTLKRRLLSMNVRYIYRGEDPGDWAYWRDYTDDGMLEYHIAPTDMTSMQYPVHEDDEHSPPATTVLDRNPHVQSVNREDDDDALPATPLPDNVTPPGTQMPDNVTPPGTQMPDNVTPPGTQMPDNVKLPRTQTPDNVTPPLTQMIPKTFAQILQTERKVNLPDTVTPHAKLFTGQGDALPLDQTHHTKDIDRQRVKTVFNPYTGRRIAVTTRPSSPVDNKASSETLARRLLTDLDDEELFDTDDGVGIPDGFTPVLSRHGKPQQDGPMKRTWQPPPPFPSPVYQAVTTAAPSMNNVTNAQPTEAENPNTTLPGPSQPAMDTFTDILHEHLQDALQQIDRKENQHMRVIEEHMADIACRKEDLVQREHQLTTAQQCFNQRQHIYIERMNHWEGDVMSQEATVTRKRIELDTAMAEFDQTISTATTRCNDLADQTKRSMRAWIEVTLEKLKTD
ncbi:hypothetical protein MHU86_12117 [Fragilaria crotonensis]|nr:hypothetical protein MHU86_12117 [Fragilaria crotonensis]